MKKTKKVLAMMLAAVLLVGASVMGTMAYLTAQDKVENTFTVGHVNITMDEQDVDNSTEGKDRDQANSYKLLPGQTYTKDPIVHFAAGSEASYLFVKVENQIAGIIDDTTKLEDQIVTTNGWVKLDGVANVYYKAVAENKTTTAVDYPVFASFKVQDNVDNTTLATYKDKTIVVTAYAVQQAGFSTASAAWAATFGAPTTQG